MLYLSLRERPYGNNYKISIVWPKSEPKNVQFFSDQILRTFYCSCLEGHAGGKLWD